MVEFNVQAYADREKVVMGLVNSGYKVTIVERPDPKRYLSKLYYIQVESAEEQQPEVTNVTVNRRDKFQEFGEHIAALLKGEKVVPLKFE